MIRLGKVTLDHSDFTFFVKRHLSNWLGTRELEKQAAGKWFAADVEMAIFEYLRSNPNSLLGKTRCRENHRKPKTENRKQGQ
jgi:hypothetical protein